MPPFRWLPLLSFPIALAVYAATAARTVTLVDSGELILAASTLGVAHPPGFPVYVLVGHLFSLLPVGSPAFRLALMSGFFAALAALLAARIDGQLRADEAAAGGAEQRGKGRGKKRRRKKRIEADADLAAPSWLPDVTSLAVGLGLAFSLTLWWYATVAEVYTLNLAFLAACFWLLLRWRAKVRATSAGRKELVLAALAYGLALGVHHVTVALAAPAIFVFVVRVGGWKRLVSRDAALATLALGAGIATYAYLPLAAGRGPLFNWGDPSSPERLWWHVSGKQYQVYLFSGLGEALAKNSRELVLLAIRQLSPLGLALAGAGIARWWRRDRDVLWLFALMSGLTVVYALQYDIAEDGDAYFLSVFFALALAFGAGLRQLSDWLRASPRTMRRWALVVAVFALTIPALGLALHRDEADHNDYEIARNYVADTLASVGDGGLVLTRDWQLYAPFLYYHHLENLRPDVAMVDINLVRRSWYVDYLDRVYPRMMAACAAERDAFIDELRDWEEGRPYDGARLTRRFHALFEAMIAHRLRIGGEAHLTLPLEPGLARGYTWLPQGLTFQMTRRPPSAPAPQAPVIDLHSAALLDEPLDVVARTKVRPTYAQMLANGATYALRHGHLERAEEALELAFELEPDLEHLHTLRRQLEEARSR